MLLHSRWAVRYSFTHFVSQALTDHPWFLGVQFHPEYRSTLAKPPLLFIEFVRAAMKQGE